jgi:hypothetical protein
MEPPGGAEPECSADVVCDDGVGCNGEERCEEGVCASGVAPECSEGMSCAEHVDGARCEYDVESPWYIFTTKIPDGEYWGIFGLRSIEMGEVQARHLTENIVEPGFLGVDWARWSPDGRYLLLSSMRSDYMSRIFYIEFGPSGPTPALPIQNLPRLDTFDIGEWSPDSKAAIVGNLFTGQLYTIDFSGQTPVPALGEIAVERAICADGSIVYWLESGDTYITDRDWTSPEHLGVVDVQFSMTSRWLRVDSEEGSWWSACERNAARRPIPEEVESFGWSPDDTYVLSFREGALEIAETATGVITWRGEVESSASIWSEDEKQLLVQETTNHLAGHPWTRIELLTLQATGLEIPAEGSPMFVGEHVAFEEVLPSELTELALVLRGSTQIRRLGPCELPVSISPDGRFLACLRRESESEERLQVFELDGNGVAAVEGNFPTLDNHTLSVLGFSPDGRGLLIGHFYRLDRHVGLLLWIPTEPKPHGPGHALNAGLFAYQLFGATWQPRP